MIELLKRAAINFVAQQIPKIMPSASSEWTIAMTNEAKSLDDTDTALSFILGCLWTCVRERTRNLEFRLNTGRYLLVSIMLLISAITYNSSSTILAFHRPTGLVFLALATGYLICASIGHFIGTRALTVSASVLLAISAISLIALKSNWMINFGLFNINLYQALATESIMIWAALTGGGCLLLKRATDSAVNTCE